MAEHDSGGGVLYLPANYDNEIGLGVGVGDHISGLPVLGSSEGTAYPMSASGGRSSGYSFAVAPGVLSPEYDSLHGFDYRREYSPKLRQIYSRYLNSPTGDFSDGCSLGGDHEGGVDGGWLGGESSPDVGVDGDDLSSAFLKAGVQIEAYERANQEYLATDPRGLNFSAYVYVATLHSKYNELVTSQLKMK